MATASRSKTLGSTSACRPSPRVLTWLTFEFMARQRSATLLLLAAILLVAVSIGPAQPRASAAGTRVRPRPELSPAARTARAAAVADVKQRLEALALPPGAHPAATLPASLHLGAAAIVPGTPNSVEAHALFVAPRSREAVLAWFKRHPPSGAKPSGGGSSAIGKRIVRKETWFEWPELPGTVRERALLIAAATRPSGGSAFRVDTQAVWITPHPPADSVPAAATYADVRLTVEGRPPTATAVTDPAEVAAIGKLINGFEATQPGEYECPELSSVSKELTLTFRAGRGGAALATVEQKLPPECGHPLVLSVGDRRPIDLEGGSLLLAKLKPVLAAAGVSRTA